MPKDQGEAPGASSQLQENLDTSDATCPDETLSQVRDHAIAEKAQTGPKKNQKKKRVKRRGVPMREEFFSKTGWTRSFISGPADPLHNSHMVWCHICKKNFSIRSKGPEEILRHHRTEKHLLKDQRWHYEHLKSVDLVTKKVQHRVRGRDGRILNRLELAKEMPHFIHAELVDIGERFPFYDDFIKGRADPLVTPDSRARTHLCVTADFLQSHGDLHLLRKLWARVSSYTDFQAALCDFDWSAEQFSVGIILANHRFE